MTRQYILDIQLKLIVDLFAGGGGMSVAFERAFGRSPDIAINHNDDALSMHRRNHPQTRHFVADVFEVCPRAATQGRPVGWLHLSPDCTHHSQARGGQPRNGKIRALTWVAIRWAGQVQPDVISLENVKQILKWGPLLAKRDRATGRVVRLDGSIAEPGERTPVEQQFLIPDPERAGATWRAFVAALECLEYVVEWRVLNAADYGGHTTRERLFMIARRDRHGIRWPLPTHFKTPAMGQKKWRAAAECIDFSDLGRSIFDRKKPLADATLRRIARGIVRYVLRSREPFIIPVTHVGAVRCYPVSELLKTITTAHRGEFALVAPVLTGVGGRAAQTEPKSVGEPINTITAKADTALVTAWLIQANGGFNTVDGRPMDAPLSTITATGSQQQLVTVALSQADEAASARVVAFLMSYYGKGGPLDMRSPAATITTKDRLALVTTWLSGEPYVITDIRLRMLSPRELYRAQDFPENYEIERGHDGRRFSISAQVRMCGNSVNSVCATTFLRANAPELAIRKLA
ncbi:MAG: DNA cytosine methyltransferase [Azoarcus sp.]|jgi:DNA (cytosine-5)-methyltransferase 1|nr:DNA cytosine methyltransferase [Azoarcus sp.]